jgi:uncharacterized membrane protein YhaH (DUF805 family)
LKNLFYSLELTYPSKIEDVAREAGLRYAQSMPEAIAISIGVLVFLAWLAYKAKDLEDPSRGMALVLLTVIAVIVVVQFPTAYGKAEAYCAEQWKKDSSRSLFQPGIPLYLMTRCASIWPQGPGR